MEWNEEIHWTVPGPVDLFDSVPPGGDPAPADRLRVPLAPGRYAVCVGRAGSCRVPRRGSGGAAASADWGQTRLTRD